MSEKQQLVEEVYGEDLATILHQYYHGDDCTQAETARAIEATLTEAGHDIDVPRSTLSYWMQTHDINTRSQTLSDFERVSIVSGIALGVGDNTIAKRLGVSKTTVRRYRLDIHDTTDPVDFERDLPDREHEFVQRLIRTARRRAYAHGGAEHPEAERATETDTETETE